MKVYMMLASAYINIFWAIFFVILGAFLGVLLMLAIAHLVPKILNKNTPHIDEEKEIMRGNVAMAQYFGRVTAAVIHGMSIIIAAAVLGGLLAGFHG